MHRIAPWLAALLAVVISPPTPALAQPSDEIVIREALVIGSLGRGGRNPFQTDTLIEAIARGTFEEPSEGDSITSASGAQRTWESLSANDSGQFSHGSLRGGYAFATVHSETDRVMLLDARGHSMVYVNGHPRAGDTYSNGYIIVPVKLNAGENTFLFKVGRGRLSATLIEPTAEIMIARRDATMPDIIAGESGPWWASVVVINATDLATDGITLVADPDFGQASKATVSIPPMSARKIGVSMRGSSLESDSGDQGVTFQIQRGETTVDEQTWTLRLREPTDKHRRTFVSQIDGSVQYYGVTPAHPDASATSTEPLALFVTLHGAGVEGMGQANAYGHKDWGHVIAPTNRRAFGFDWEDWGRMDAMEVLDLAHKRFGTDPQRTYLTGHSMGGHGAWQVGVLFPDRFAVIAPSAGWVSFWSYTGAREYENATEIEQIIRRAATPSDTLALSRNYLHNGIYILHGSQDDNVPVAQARTMRSHLGSYHSDFAYFEQPGAGHWWGNRCVDWPPMFDFFNRHTIKDPASINHIEFVTANPGINASSHWVTIHNQATQLAPSSVNITFDPKSRRFTGETDNVAFLSIDLSPFPAGGSISVHLDTDIIEEVSSPAGTRRIYFERDDDGSWSVAGVPSLDRKGPHRTGPFKQAFTNRMVYVYGTAGTPAENDWAFDKARLDAETFWYRGNGSIDVVSDRSFLADEKTFANRNVILVGNADTNAAWSAVLQDCPINVTSGSIAVGVNVHRGDDIASIFVYPRAHTDDALVAVISGTGLAGMRSTDRLPYFVSGVHYPDWVVFGPSVWSEGTDGVTSAGFFSNAWQLPNPN